VENDTDTTPFTDDTDTVENVTVLPIRDEPIIIFVFTVEPMILDVTRVLPARVETVITPP